MRASYPQTIDISAIPVKTAVEARLVDLRSAINQTLGADAFLLVGSLLIGIVCSGVTSSLRTGSELNGSTIGMLSWFVFGACNVPSLLFLLADTLKASRCPIRIPFAYPPRRVKAIYAKRVHLALLAIYFSAIFSAFCWSVPAMPVFSRLFVAAVFAIALYALGQSISSIRKSFFMTGTIFLVVLVAAQLFALAR